MTPLFKKLNYKDQDEIVILQSPDSFEGEVIEMSKICQVRKKLEDGKKYSFMMVFVKKQSDVDQYSQLVKDNSLGDAITWFVYPKKSSKKYNCDFDRDHGWQSLGDLGLEGVRMVAIDEDWSALRFRKVEYIKTLKRSFAMSPEGKKRTGKGQ